MLYTYGGIYMDLDMGCKYPMDGILAGNSIPPKLVLPKSSNIDSFYTNSLMMCTPKHPFMMYCMEHLRKSSRKSHRMGKHLHVMNSTGPSFLTSMVNKFNPDLQTLSKSVFSGNCSACNLKTCKGGSLFWHVTGETWHGSDSRVYNFLMCNRRLIILLPILILIFFWKIKPSVKTLFLKF
jgi:mannosyltransferase OCH1-like enzyme